MSEYFVILNKTQEKAYVRASDVVNKDEVLVQSCRTIDAAKKAAQECVNAYAATKASPKPSESFKEIAFGAAPAYAGPKTPLKTESEFFVYAVIRVPGCQQLAVVRSNEGFLRGSFDVVDEFPTPKLAWARAKQG